MKQKLTEFNQTKGLKLPLKQRMRTYHFSNVEMLAERYNSMLCGVEHECFRYKPKCWIGLVCSLKVFPCFWSVYLLTTAEFCIHRKMLK